MHYVEENETSRTDKNRIKESEREKMALPNRMSLRPGLLWLTLNLALDIQCLSWNNIFFFFLILRTKMSSRTPGGTRTPGWIPLF
jgi:hypothetical protein